MQVRPCMRTEASTFPFDVAVAHLELAGGVGGAPGLVQDCVVEAGVTTAPQALFLTFLFLLLLIIIMIM